MLNGNSKSFRLKRHDSEPDSNNDQKRHNHSFSNMFKRNKKEGFPKSQSMRLKGKTSLDLSALNATKPNSKGRMEKSQSFPNDLALISKDTKNRTFTINGEKMDLSRVPELPPFKSLTPEHTSSKKEEFRAVRRKLLGKTHNVDNDEDDDIEDDDEFEEEEEEGEHIGDDDEFDYAENTTIPTPKSTQNRSSKHHDFLPGSLSRRLSRHHLKPTVTMQSSTPNHSQTSLLNDENATSTSNNNASTTEDDNHLSLNQPTGLFSSLINTLNLKSFTDLTNHHDDDKEIVEDELTDIDNHTVSSSLSSPKTHVAQNDALDAVKFVPVKKALISTLGQGSLTLDAFPKNETQLPTDQSHLNVPTANNNHPKKQTLQLPQPPDMMISASDGNFFGTDKNVGTTNNEIKSVPITARSRSSMSPLPRKQTMKNNRNSLVSIKSDDEDGSNALPMLNSMSFKKKIFPARKSIDSVNNSIMMTNSNEGNNLDDILAKKKEYLFEKLDIKPPSDKRQEAFHSLFPSLPLNEIFIEDFACAYRKEILVQGKLYLSEHHISFHSNIIGLVTRLTIPLNAILKIQKRKTVGIPNAIEFSNLHNKYIFASFMSRDPTYSLIHKVWKSNINSDGFDTIDLDLDDDIDSLDCVSADDFEEDDGDNHPKPLKGVSGNKTAINNGTDSGNIGNNAVDTSDTSISDPEDMVKDGEDDKDNTEIAQANSDHIFNGLTFEGPKTHPPTSNGYVAESSDTKIIEETIAAPMGVIFNLLFGDDTAFVKNLLKVQKNYDIGEIPKFSGNKRTYQYTKPLNSPVGPKQTKCIVEEIVDHKDFNQNCLIFQITDSPDVPSGNSFKVKTKIYLSWATNNATKIYVATTVVWTGKSWIKGAIEKGTISGQKESMGILISELKKKIASGGTVGVSPSKGKAKEKNKRVREGTASSMTTETPVETVIATPEPEPKSYFDLIFEQVDIKFVLIIILFVIVITDKFKSPKHNGGYELYSNHRMLMSESSLWEWIEKRELMNGVDPDSNGLNLSHTKSNPQKIKNKNKFLHREPLDKMGKRKMSEQELRDTIDMIELQLEKLKERENSQNSNLL